MRALVTGATGFVGSHLVEALVARGDEVVALARRPAQDEGLARLGARPVRGSLEDPAALAAALDGVAVVYHVAGLTAARSEREFLAVNEGGTRTLLEACRRAGPTLIRFVHVSTQAALGPSAPGVPLAEDAPCHPLSAYGRSKLAAEAVVRAGEVPWVIVRPPVVYGPRDREFLKLFRLVKLGLNPVLGTGDQAIAMVYAPDLAQALARAGSAAGAVGRIYHAAHPAGVTYREIGLAFARALGGGRRPITVRLPLPLAAVGVWGMERAAWLAGRASVVSTDRLPEFRAPAWLLAVDRAERELGWSAAHDVDAGAAATAAWYRAHGWL